MFRWYFQSDEVVVQNLIHYKNPQFPEWWKNFCNTPDLKNRKSTEEYCFVAIDIEYQ